MPRPGRNGKRRDDVCKCGGCWAMGGWLSEAAQQQRKIPVDPLHSHTGRAPGSHHWREGCVDNAGLGLTAPSWLPSRRDLEALQVPVQSSTPRSWVQPGGRFFPFKPLRGLPTCKALATRSPNMQGIGDQKLRSMWAVSSSGAEEAAAGQAGPAGGGCPHLTSADKPGPTWAAPSVPGRAQGFCQPPGGQTRAPTWGTHSCARPHHNLRHSHKMGHYRVVACFLERCIWPVR